MVDAAFFAAPAFGFAALPAELGFAPAIRSSDAMRLVYQLGAVILRLCGQFILDKPQADDAPLRSMNDEFISDLARRLRKLVPPSAEGAARDLETNFRALLQSALGRSDYVTFEEFEAQKRVLERTRSKVESLERTLAEMKSGGD